MRLRRMSRGDSGASAVEFALIVPLLMLIIFGIINFGILFSQQITINNGVREGARRAVVADPAAPPRSCDQIITSVRNQLSGIALNAAQVQIKVSQNGWSDGNGCGSSSATTNFGGSGTNIPCTNGYNAANHSGSLVVEARYPSSIPVSFPPFPTTMTLTSKAVYRCEFTS